jgi:hypothetical protein
MKYALLTAVMALALIPMGTQTASAHGCHRDAEVGRYGLHHHRGPDCDRVAGRREYRSYRRDYDDRRRYDRDDRRGPPQCVKKCQYIGPIKTCDTICR